MKLSDQIKGNPLKPAAKKKARSFATRPTRFDAGVHPVIKLPDDVVTVREGYCGACGQKIKEAKTNAQRQREYRERKKLND